MEQDERIEMIQKQLQKQLEELENSPGFAIRMDGIQEENSEIRKEEKGWLTKHFPEIFGDLFPIVEYDPDAVFKFVFGYFCNHYYKQGKRVPITHEEFAALFQQFYPNAIELEGLLDKNSIYNMRSLMNGFSLARVFEDVYIEKEIPMTMDSYQWIVKKEQQRCKKIKMILDAFLEQYEPLFMGTENHIFFAFHDDGRFQMCFGSSVHELYSDIQQGLVSFYHDKTKQVKIDIAYWIDDIVKEYKKASQFAEELAQDVKLFFKDSLKKPNVCVRYEGGQYLVGLSNRRIKTEFVTREDALYRHSGERVEYLRAIVSEFVERSRRYEEDQKIILERAEKLFRQLLSKNEKTMFDSKGAVLIEGEDYDYLIDTDAHHNNTVRFPKGVRDIKQAESICIVAKEVHVPKFDVLSSVLLMIKSKKEKFIHDIGHRSPTGEYHLKRWDELGILHG